MVNGVVEIPKREIFLNSKEIALLNEIKEAAIGFLRLNGRCDYFPLCVGIRGQKSILWQAKHLLFKKTDVRVGEIIEIALGELEKEKKVRRDGASYYAL